MDPLRQLLQEAASNLGGHPVKVRWRRPARPDAKAVCFKHNDQAVIDLDPSLNWDSDSLLYTIAHEAGHVRDLFEEWTETPDYKSGSIRFPSEARNHPVVIEIEATADRLARQWVNHAKANYKRYWEPGDLGTMAAYLRCLANWSE